MAFQLQQDRPEKIVIFNKNLIDAFNQRFKTFARKYCMIVLCRNRNMSDRMEGESMVKISKVETGKRIRNLLAEYGITVRDVQEEMELESPQSVYKWLNGKALPSLDNLLILSDMLDMPIERILVLEGIEDSEIIERRERWIRNHPPVLRAYKFTGKKHLQTFSMMISDTKTDWHPSKCQETDTETEASDEEEESPDI